MNTLAYKEFHKVLERGGVIGGQLSRRDDPGRVSRAW